jgi:hypothetical protein
MTLPLSSEQRRYATSSPRTRGELLRRVTSDPAA